MLGIAIIGATGLVGRKILEVLKERKFPIKNLTLVASDNSEGKELVFNNNKFLIKGITKFLSSKEKYSFILMSAGGEVSKKHAKEFSKKGIVIDNSSTWRMDKKTPLIIPEVNGSILKKGDTLISNPNCSTIQLLIAINPIHQKYKIEKLIISTYQSVTGSGVKGVNQLEKEEKKEDVEKLYSQNIHRNCIPHCDDFLENRYTKEEVKIINETKKILNNSSLKITATAVRVPVTGGHSESVYMELEKEFKSITEIQNILKKEKSIILKDNPFKNIYPSVLDSQGKDEVFVGRIRKGIDNKSLNIWVVADNLRKGAATNTVQIAEYIYKNKKELLNVSREII